MEYKFRKFSKNTNMTITVRDTREWRLRRWIGLKLMVFGAMVTGMSVEVRVTGMSVEEIE